MGRLSWTCCNNLPISILGASTSFVVAWPAQIYPCPVKRTGIRYLNISPGGLAEVGLRPEDQYPGKWQRGEEKGRDEREVDIFKALKSQGFFV